MDTRTDIPVRNLEFALDPVAMRHWHGGRKAITAFFDNLSLFFPAGERFFVASVKAHQERVTDPRLRDDVRAFCGQEGLHTREHVRYNRMLEAQGYPAAKLEARTERILKRVTRVVPARRRLAATCALEHFTAALAHGVLSDPQLLEGANPTMAALWSWHAAEESEHKAVAFDVFKAAGGTYLERAWVMIATTLIFWALVIDQQARMMRADGTLFSLREWGSLFVFLWVHPGGLRKMWRLYLGYFKPSFHPWEHDNRDVLEDWKRSHPVSPGYPIAKVSA